MRGVALALVLVLAGCAPNAGPSDAGAACVSIGAACPSPAPSYATDIAPLVEARCVGCHFPGTVTAPTDLSTYPQLRRQGGTTLGVIQSCMMPPPDAGVLSEAERTTFVEWLRCGAPNN